MGGDEFIITLEGEQKRSDLLNIAQALVDLVEEPIIFNQVTFSVSVSIGINSYVENITEVSSVLHHADIAMYHAKTHNTHIMFAKDLLLIED